ncbi:hypothetical protein [Salinarimonas sp.]|uniref:hypothetical protein n=1 Tax=Salinarimonas sp. TaxID=2766526 RepID=UPI0032D8D8FA
MITALIRAGDDPRPLAATISALVAGVADGVIGDAVVIAPARAAAIEALADAAGAELVIAGAGEDPWRVGARAARRDWLFCLDAGDVPLDGWARAVERFATAAPAPAPPAMARLHRRVEGLGPRLREALRARTPRIRAGDLVHVGHLKPGARPKVVRLPASVTREEG